MSKPSPHVMAQALKIADDASRTDIESFGVEIESERYTYALTDHHGDEVGQVCNASFTLRKATAYLVERQLAEVVLNGDGAEAVRLRVERFA